MVKWKRKRKNFVPNCDLDIYVDNIRKYIVKNYRVHSERNNSTNVINAVINIELPEIQKLMEKEIVKAQNNFREYRYNYLFSLLKFL